MAPTDALFMNPKRLVLEMAWKHGLAELFRLVVDRLTESARLAMARVRLVQPSEACNGCVMAAEPVVQEGRTRVLPLFAFVEQETVGESRPSV